MLTCLLAVAFCIFRVAHGSTVVSQHHRRLCCQDRLLTVCALLCWCSVSPAARVTAPCTIPTIPPSFAEAWLCTPISSSGLDVLSGGTCSSACTAGTGTPYTATCENGSFYQSVGNCDGEYRQTRLPGMCCTELSLMLIFQLARHETNVEWRGPYFLLRLVSLRQPLLALGASACNPFAWFLGDHPHGMHSSLGTVPMACGTMVSCQVRTGLSPTRRLTVDWPRRHRLLHW